MKPTKYRPNCEFDDLILEDDCETWENNIPSNFLAWVSDMFMPDWCKDPDHWTVKVVLYFWADCACCLFFRGVTLGLLVGLTFSAFVGLLF